MFQLNRTNTRRQLGNAEIISILGFLSSGARSTQDNGEKSRGIEGQLLFAPFRGYQISTNYSYIDTALVSPDNRIRAGGPITGRPRSNGSLFHKYAGQGGLLKDCSFNHAIGWVDGFRADRISGSTGLVTNYIPGYIRVDLGAGYRCRLGGKPFTFALSVRNVENKQIMEGLQSNGDLRSDRFSTSRKF